MDVCIDGWIDILMAGWIYGWMKVYINYLFILYYI